MLKNLAGKGALIVGAKRVGHVIGRRMAQEGINLAIAYRRSQAEAETLQREVASLVEKTTLIQGDISIEESVQSMVKTAKQELGDLSFVVNLASGFPKTPFETLDGKAWENSLSDAKGSYLLGVYASRELMKNSGSIRGHIIFFSDWAALETPYKDFLPYLTAKSAIDFMTRAFAMELAEYRILVNAIAPGPTQRPADISPESWQKDVLEQAPLKRESSAEEIAEAIIMLLKSETITGETIRVDSGRYLVGPGL
ncbi:MAG: SDR family oxidoreductase [Symploca sp. SIO2C1]|nr:SDR family oxidoreductase [Symploca sp. SIO2C1]